MHEMEKRRDRGVQSLAYVINVILADDTVKIGY